MGTKVLWYKGTTGLNTVVDPVSIPYDMESGIGQLGVAVNVSVRYPNRIGRRKGSTLQTAGDFHSLFSSHDSCFVVSGDSLYSVGTDYAITGIRSGLTVDARMSFVHAMGHIYYANGVENGHIINGSSFAWPEHGHVGPTTSRNFSTAPVGTHLAYYNGRMLVAEGNILWYSEPFAMGKFDLARNFIPLHGDIRMVRVVKDGVFVSTEFNTLFLRGEDITKATVELVADYPAIEWSDAHDMVEGMEIGLGNPGLCLVWASQEGACLGTATGQFINLNKENVVYPEKGLRGAGLLYGYNYIHTIE